MRKFQPLSFLLLATALLTLSSFGCQAQTNSTELEPNVPAPASQSPSGVDDQNSDSQAAIASGESYASKKNKLETATFGGGCFWCTEAVFLQLKGVKSVKSGYMGGHVENPTYEQICTKTTGHAEVIQIKFDPKKVRFDDLLKIHLKTHDPTSWDKQGNDEGPQYRSIVFYHNEAQKEKTNSYKKKLNEENVFGKPIVTQVKKAVKFWVAEDYHQNYFKKNPNNPYCQAFIPKKLAKLKAIFSDKLKGPKGSGRAKSGQSQ